MHCQCPTTSVAFFRTIAERDPPRKRVRELWIIVGRRGGKDFDCEPRQRPHAALFNSSGRLRRNERALVACLACDSDQAKIVLDYTRSYFDHIPALRSMVTRRIANGFQLNNGVDIASRPTVFRSIRGRPILCAIFDEVSLMA